MIINELEADKFAGTAFLRIQIKSYGNRAKVRDDQALQSYLKLLHAADGEETEVKAIEVNGAAKAVNTTKVLIRSEALDKLNQFITETKNGLVGKFGKANPSRIMDGMFIVALPLVAEFEDTITEARKKMRDELIPAAVADYEAAIERARTEPVKKGGLGPLFNQADYVTPEVFASRFGIETQWLTLKPADQLPPEIRERNEAEFREKMQNAWEEVGSAMRVGFLELISHATDKLKPGEDGRTKIFRETTFTNLQAFIDCFDARNITGDKALADLVGKAQEILIGIDTKAVRKDVSIRDETQKKFQEIQNSLEVEVKKNRIIRLEEMPDEPAVATA